MTLLKKIVTLIFLFVFILPHNVKAFSVSDIETVNQAYQLDMSQQSFCVADDSKMILEHNSDALRFPASVSKLYVTDWILQIAPKEFRFKTQFVQKGNTLYVFGGHDPQFISEHLWYVLYRIQSQTNTKITSIVFDSKLYFNWEYDATTIKKQMQLALRSPSRVSGGVLAQTRAKLLYKKDFPNRAIPSISPKITVTFSPIISRAITGARYTLASPARDDLLKYMNIYSSNSIANVLFSEFGGISAFTTYMKQTYGVTEQNFVFTTGSGLAANSVTCRLTLSVLKHIKQATDSQSVLLENIIALPGEEGTLTNRLFGNQSLRAVVMKTGNVWSHVTLAGFIKTETGIKYFVFLNNATGATEKLVNDTRKFQDHILTRYLSELHPVSFQPKDSTFMWSYFVFQKN